MHVTRHSCLARNAHIRGIFAETVPVLNTIECDSPIGKAFRRTIRGFHLAQRIRSFARSTQFVASSENGARSSTTVFVPHPTPQRHLCLRTHEARHGSTRAVRRRTTAFYQGLREQDDELFSHRLLSSISRNKSQSPFQKNAHCQPRGDVAHPMRKQHHPGCDEARADAP